MDTVVIMGGGTFDFVAVNGATSRTFNPIGLGANVDELAIVVSHALAGTGDVVFSAVPAGWNQPLGLISTGGSAQAGFSMSWKKLTSDDNANYDFFNTGATAYRHQIFRFNTSLSLFETFDGDQSMATGDPASQVKNAAGEVFPLIVIAMCGSIEIDGVVGSFSTFSPAAQFSNVWSAADFFGDHDGSGTSGGIVYNPGDTYQNVTVDRAGNGDRNWLASFILRGVG